MKIRHKSRLSPKYGILIVLMFLIAWSCNRTTTNQTSNINKNDFSNSEFVGSKTCKSCHTDQFKDWEGSHHDLAMQEANSSTILGDFNQVVFNGKNAKSTFFKKDGNYYVNTTNSEGEYQDFKIEYTFGVDPLQQYIVKFPDGAYQCLLTAWDSRENKWFHLQPDLEIRHAEWLNWSKGSMRWNTMCADCHSTNLKKNFDPDTETYNTTYNEIDVGCESCHGPASEHVSFYNSEEQNGVPPAMYMHKGMRPKEVVDKCARCHSRRSPLTEYFDYTSSYSDHYNIGLPVEPEYELDGQIKGEDYVVGSFLQSKMYHNDVSCIDCHDVHTLKLKKQGNALCVSCHETGYDDASHHFHAIGYEGAECINCHMPGKTYMGNDYRRDHSFRVPRPDQSEVYGTPNTCNGCHADKSAQWASKAIVDHFGPNRADHFSDSLLAGYYSSPTAFQYVLRNGEYPDIIRASALRQLSNRILSKEEANELIGFLGDSSVWVRNEAIVALSNVENPSVSKWIEPLLEDTSRRVRISAVDYFVARRLTPQSKYDTAYANAKKEQQTQLDVVADFAAGQHQRALDYQNNGKIDLAIGAYRKAIEIDDLYNTSRMNLALLLVERGDVKGAEKAYLKVIETEPAYSYSYYMLGLLYNEQGDTEKSLKYLAEACGKRPVVIRAYYNYSLKLQEVGRDREALKMIDDGLKILPNNEEFLYIRLLSQLKLKQTKNALETCSTLLQIAPQNGDYRRIMNELRKRSNGI